MQESIERRKRGELTPDEAEGIIKAKEEYDNKYRPYDFDDSFLDPWAKLPMHDPVRGKCGHLFDRGFFIEFTEKNLKTIPMHSIL